MKAPELEITQNADELDVKELEPNISPRIAIEMDVDDKADLDYIIGEIDKAILLEYSKAFELENSILAKVRVKLPNGDWMVGPDGSYVEDWERLTVKDLENFIQAGSSWTFFLNQAAINSYAEAVFAKYTYDDAYDEAYVRQVTGTVGDKTARAKRRTQRERWIALYKTLYHKRAKEVVDRLDQHVRRIERIYSERMRESERQFRASIK